MTEVFLKDPSCKLQASASFSDLAVQGNLSFVVTESADVPFVSGSFESRIEEEK